MRNSYFLGNYKNVLEMFEENFQDSHCNDIEVFSLLIRTILALNEPEPTNLIDKLMATKEFSQTYRMYKEVFDPIAKGVESLCN